MNDTGNQSLSARRVRERERDAIYRIGLDLTTRTWTWTRLDLTYDMIYDSIDF